MFVSFLSSRAQDIDCGSYVDFYLNAALDDKSVSMSLVDTALSHLFSVQVRDRGRSMGRGRNKGRCGAF